MSAVEADAQLAMLAAVTIVVNGATPEVVGRFTEL
jgi:hypothetical protein